MTLELILFIILALVAIAAALGMVISRNTVYSALFLILNFVTVAVLYLMLNAAFLAMAQIAVYTGAIMVLFLFVIMLLGAESLPGKDQLSWQKPMAILLGAVLLAESAYILVTRVGILPPAQTAAENFGSPEAIGLTLFKQYLLPFEVTSVVLLVAIIGAVVLSRRVK